MGLRAESLKAHCAASAFNTNTNDNLGLMYANEHVCGKSRRRTLDIVEHDVSRVECPTVIDRQLVLSNHAPGQMPRSLSTGEIPPFCGVLVGIHGLTMNPKCRLGRARLLTQVIWGCKLNMHIAIIDIAPDESRKSHDILEFLDRRHCKSHSGIESRACNRICTEAARNKESALRSCDVDFLRKYNDIILVNVGFPIFAFEDEYRIVSASRMHLDIEIDLMPHSI